MATYYVDPAATGANDGSSWIDAWTSLQSATLVAVASDIVKCRGTQTLTSAITVNTNNGGFTTGYIKYIGCNANGNIDGTRFILDADSTAINCLILYKSYHWFENIECRNAINDGINILSGGANTLFFNNLFTLNGDSGVYINSNYICFILCGFINNGQDGLEYVGGNYGTVLFCYSIGNSRYGVYVAGLKSIIFGSIIHDNTNNNIIVNSYVPFLLNNVIDNTDEGIVLGNSINGLILGNRITNNQTGINGNRVNIFGFNYFHNNTNDTINDSLLGQFAYKDVSDTNEYDTDADDGYNDPANDDFNIKVDRALRRTEIDLGYGG